jgi:hypothetical protein
MLDLIACYPDRYRQAAIAPERERNLDTVFAGFALGVRGTANRLLIHMGESILYGRHRGSWNFTAESYESFVVNKTPTP